MSENYKHFFGALLCGLYISS